MLGEGLDKMAKYEIARRTFEAKKFPKGSEARKRLNRNPITSEYIPSEKFIVFKNKRQYASYRTLSLAKHAVEVDRKYGGK